MAKRMLVVGKMRGAGTVDPTTLSGGREWAPPIPPEGWHDLSPMIVPFAALGADERGPFVDELGSIWCDGDEMTILVNGGIEAVTERYKK